MSSTNPKGRFGIEKRYSGKRHFEDGPELMERPHPQSLTMGPDVIFRNAWGEPEAVAMTEEWRPVFKVVTVKIDLGDSTWTL